MRSPVAASRFSAEQMRAPQTISSRHRETPASTFPASTTARSAWTNLPIRDGAHPHIPSPPRDETNHAAALAIRKEDHRQQDANHAQANSQREQRIRLWADVKLLPAAYSASPRGRCT